MKIRSTQIWTKEDLYNEYVNDADDTFDVITLGLSIYLSGKYKLNHNAFFNQCRVTVINKYMSGETYEDYLKAKENISSLILPNNHVILTSSTDYTRYEFNQVSNGGFIAPSKRVKQFNIVDFIYNSNKIENIDIPLNDTSTLLEGGNIPNIKYDDMAAVLNHKDCFDYRLSLGCDMVTSIYHLCRMQYELMKGLRHDAGQLRLNNVYIGSATHEFPGPDMLSTLLSDLTTIKEEDIILQASLLHAGLINIHPFSDGNGRIGRLATYPYTNISYDDRIEYYQALDAYGAHGSIQPMYKLLHSTNSIK